MDLILVYGKINYRHTSYYSISRRCTKEYRFLCGYFRNEAGKKNSEFRCAGEVYHFYYGDETGTPGSILTFFPYEGIDRGRHGKGMLNTTTFSVNSSALNYWLERLKKYGVNYKDPVERFGTETVVYFEDHDGLGLELVFNDNDKRTGFTYGNIPLENSIKGFYSAEIWLEGYERTAGLLTEQMDHTLIAEKGNRFRFAASDLPGNYIDLLCSPESLED